MLENRLIDLTLFSQRILYTEIHYMPRIILPFGNEGANSAFNVYAIDSNASSVKASRLNFCLWRDAAVFIFVLLN